MQLRAAAASPAAAAPSTSGRPSHAAAPVLPAAQRGSRRRALLPAARVFQSDSDNELRAPQFVEQGREWLSTILSRFGPMQSRAQVVTTLDFEKPLLELDKRINEVRTVAEANGVDVTQQVAELENRAQDLRRETYSRLTPVQRLQVARHPNRPTCLDIILNITDKFVELHGDRAGLDDPAVVCGIGSMDGTSFMFIGHQKGRNTKENIRRNFGMPQPNGYRKALRFMRHADKFGIPIVTFVDTPGAYAGKAAEELGQGEAIAYNLREMFGLRVPIISVVIGEGGSGGALAIGCANRNLIMENSVYYVASPEACAAILWKNRDATNLATEALRITAPELVGYGVMDTVVPEPLGGAHADPVGAFPYIKQTLLDTYEPYTRMSENEIKLDRYRKFRALGRFREHVVKAGDWRGSDAERESAAGARTAAGAWAASEEEARFIERVVDADEEWEALLEKNKEWVNRPVQPPGLGRTGIMDVASSVVELRRRKQQQASGGWSAGSSNGSSSSSSSNGSSNGALSQDAPVDSVHASV